VDFLEGIPHQNNKPENEGALWDVVRAVASAKTHYLDELQELFDVPPTPTSPGGLQWVFASEFPNLMPPSEGVEPLSDDAWAKYQRDWRVRSHAEYVKHLLAKHDGEARQVGEATWGLVPASGGSVRQARFWHYQFTTQSEVRKYLWGRSREDWCDDDITEYEMYWILKM